MFVERLGNPVQVLSTLHFWLLKSIPIFEDLRKVEWHLKDSFFSNVALPVRPFWKDKVALSTNLNVHFMCTYVMCVWVDISRAVNFRTPRWIFFLSFYLALPYPSLFSFFNRFFFRRHRTVSLSANSAEEAMWEFICPTSTTLVLPLRSCHPLLSSAFYPFGDLRPTRVTDFRT